MKTYFSVAIILASFLPVHSQPSTSHVIDSLKNRSLTLNGVERVDCLDLLALTIFRSRMSLSEDSLNKDKDRANSVYKYASRAFEEAKRIDYRKGTAFSLTLLAIPDYLRGIDLRYKKKDESEANQAVEKYLTQAISIADKAGDNETLGFVYIIPIGRKINGPSCIWIYFFNLLLTLPMKMFFCISWRVIAG